VYGLAEKKLHQLTAGYYNDADPVFDPGGKYLFFQTDRRLQPLYSGLDATWIYPNATQIAYASLDPTAKSLLVARNDEVKITTDTTAAPKPAAPDKPAVPVTTASSVKSITVKPENFETRVLPVPAGNYGLWLLKQIDLSSVTQFRE
jgi:tricorn protease